MKPTIAYVAEGKLYTISPRGMVKAFESPFVMDLLQRDERRAQRDGWKQDSAGWNATAPAAMLAAQMGLQGPGTGRRIQYTAVAASDEPGRCLFALHTDTVGGVFELTLPDEERRLVHQPNLLIQDLSRHPLPNGEGMIACSIPDQRGACHLATMRRDGGRLIEITEGDSMDQCPSWVPVPEKTLVYQSAGIARDTNGFQRALSPYRIEKLNLDRGTLDTIAEDHRYDLLMPRMDDEQVLYYIRRPYLRDGYEHVPALTRLKYALLWPFGVLLAIGAFLNVFSTMFRGKPLTPASGPAKPGPDSKQMFLWGRRIAADKIIKNNAADESITVPKDWELCRVDATGNPIVLARGVACFDLTPDGSIVYSDARRIVYQSPAGEESEIARHELVQTLAFISKADD